MTMLAEVAGAVIGTGTHRDTHEAEIADAAGRTLTVLQVSNDSAGFARLLATVAQVAPGPRIVACSEGGRSYGIGLARALTASGLLVTGCEQPSRRQRRGKGKSGPIDAHLAVLAALRLDAARLPVLRADGDREALRILLAARQEIKVAATAQASRLRALLLTGGEADRRAARRSLGNTALTTLTGRQLPAGAAREHVIRQAEISRLAAALTQARRQLKHNKAQLLAIADDLTPGLTSRFGIGPVSAAQAIASFSHPGRCRSEAAFAALGGHQPGPGQQRQNHPAPAQPRRRPRPQPRHPRHRHQQDPQLPPHPRLRRPPHHRRKDPPRNPPLPQALHRPRALPPAHPDDEPSRESLTNIEASEGGACTVPERMVGHGS
jgi:hypothetical protein